jgi:hypothetical protein
LDLFQGPVDTLLEPVVHGLLFLATIAAAAQDIWLTAKKVSHWYGRRFLIFA